MIFTEKNIQKIVGLDFQGQDIYDMLVVLMVQKSHSQPPGMVLKLLVNNGWQLPTSTGELIPDFWLPSRVSTWWLRTFANPHLPIVFQFFPPRPSKNYGTWYVVTESVGAIFYTNGPPIQKLVLV